MKDETSTIKFKTYRFPNRTFLFTKQDLKEYRQREEEILVKEIDLLESIKDKEVKNIGE